MSGKLIIDIAREFIGLYEIKQNSVWDNKEKSDKLLQLMKPTGFKPGYAYCMCFCLGMWRAAKQPVYNMTPGVVDSFNKVKDKTTKIPTPGSIFFMQLGRTAKGHSGIVVSYDEVSKRLITIEGNTSPANKTVSASADREGDGIFQKSRILNFNPSSTGLFFLGFLNPDNIA